MSFLMRLLRKVVGLVKKHALVFAIGLFWISCLIVPYRLAWKFKKLSGDEPVGYYFLFSEPHSPQAIRVIFEALPDSLINSVTHFGEYMRYSDTESFFGDNGLYTQTLQRLQHEQRNGSISWADADRRISWIIEAHRANDSVMFHEALAKDLKEEKSGQLYINVSNAANAKVRLDTSRLIPQLMLTLSLVVFAFVSRSRRKDSTTNSKNI